MALGFTGGTFAGAMYGANLASRPWLQTLLEIGSEQNSTVVFPLPIDLIGPLMQAVRGQR